MRTGQQNKRGRGRSNNNNSNSNNNSNNRKHSNPLSRSYDSTGPDVKVRGTAQHVAEKYMTLARDAHSAGDRVMAENYLQHAEHYNRIIAVGQAQMQERQQREDAAREQQQQQQERDVENAPTVDTNADAKEAVEAQDATQGANMDGANVDGASDEDRANRKPQPRRRNNPRPRRPRVQETAATETPSDVAPAASTPVAPVSEVQTPAAQTPKTRTTKKAEAPVETVKPTEVTTPAE